MNLTLDAQIESLLFWKAEALSFSTLASLLKVSEQAIQESIPKLQENLASRGIQLLQNDKKISLETHPEMSPIIEQLTKEELNKELSKPALETLSIIIYRAPVKRSEIDYIRGVNSQFILRSLLIRGLIDKSTDPADERAFVYKPSMELLSYLGITSLENLPEYDTVRRTIEGFMGSKEGEKPDNIDVSNDAKSSTSI